MNVCRLIACAAATLALAGCSGYGDLAPAGKLAAPQSFESAKSLAGVATGEPASDWWRAFGDPQLDALIDEALRANPGLKLAEARLAGARAEANMADAARMPQVTANFQADRERFPEHYIWPQGYAGQYFDQARLALDFSYDLDFWGRNRAVLDGALSYAKAAEVDRDAARLILTVAVARSYVELDRLYAHRDLLEKLVEQRNKAYQLSVIRVKAGLDGPATEARFAVQRAAAERELPGVDQQLDMVRHELAALLGAGPDRALTIKRPQLADAGRLALPSVLPVDLLGRRPDVVAQRLRVEAAEKFGQAARADFYPNINLVGFVGNQALGLPNLLTAGSSIVGLGPAVSLPLFGAGTRLRAQLSQRYADYDAAVAEYNQTLTDALKDIANAVSSWRGVEARDAAERTVLAETGNIRDDARYRYGGGLTNESQLIEVQSDLLDEQRRAIDIRAQRFAAAIELNRALGGGFKSGPDAPVAEQHAASQEKPQESP